MSSFRERISGLASRNTPTVRAFPSKVLSSPFQTSSSMTGSSMPYPVASSFSCSLNFKPLTIRPVILSISKFAFVIVEKSASTTKRLICAGTSTPAFRNRVATTETPLVTNKSRSIRLAVSSSFPQTPLIVQPVPFAAS